MSRIAIVEKQKCNPLGCGGYLCIRVCPINREGSECIKKADDGKAAIDEELCIGCDICVHKCPFDAIHIINLPEQLKEPPVHRYSRNEFHLYNIPVPQFGKVVGLVGRNGIGKSTAMKILAGLLKPNLGQDKEPDIKEVLSFFKGREAQGYFERLRKNDINVAYKPQQVDAIPKVAKGTVSELLSKEADMQKMASVLEALDLVGLADRNIATLSGGELQRLAIAATALKKANVYIFDEPTSFLDIKQRMRVAQFIKSLATETTAVLVVDHDLIMLDYMADLIHVAYGKEACYGIVSNPMATTVGINSFLEGFLASLNMRFREKPIVFQPAPPSKIRVTPEIVSWSALAVDLEKFQLSAREGSLHEGVVVGVLGENGIGKTTFVKLLADVFPPKEGKVSTKIRVSYKPQYLQTDSEELVGQYLKEAEDKFRTQIIEPMGIQALMARRLCDLSGGELQRVSIAKALSVDAQLYLLDEPSAYLDVEQRMNVSKVIREIMRHRETSALVVDHDLLFLDYLSQQLMVFTGRPAIHGSVEGPFGMEDGMNKFLSSLKITVRRDKESKRPRMNKQGSVLDREQQNKGNYYYS